MRRMSLGVMLLMCVASLPVAADVTAQLTPATTMPRIGGPIPVQVEVISTETAAINGTLCIVSEDAGHTHESLPVTVPAGGRVTLRLLLPPLAMAPPRIDTLVKLELRTAERTYNLGSSVLADATDAHSRVVAYSTAWPESPRLEELLLALKLVQFENALSTVTGIRVHVAQVRLQTDELPRTAFELCAYDLVVLHGREVLTLGAEQRRALAAWTRAGGALCLYEFSAGLTTTEQRIVGELAAPEWLEPPIESQFGSFLFNRSGLGLVAIDVSRPSAAIERSGRDWQAIALRLWRVRSEVSARVLSPDPSAPRRLFYRREVLSVQDLMSFLSTPPSERLPQRQITIVLFVFVIVAGPLDVLLFKRLKWPALTWLSLPIWCVAFFIVTVWIADSHLGGTTRESHLRVLDVDEDGQMIREYEFELLFAQAEGVRRREQSEVLFHSVRYTKDDLDDLQQGRWFLRSDSELIPREASAISTAGAYPLIYQLVQQHKKWAPLMSEKLRFGPVVLPHAELPWRTIVGVDRRDSAAVARVLDSVARSLAGANRTVECYLFQDGRIVAPAGSRSVRHMLDLQVLARRAPSRLGWLYEREAPAATGQAADLYLISEDNLGDAVFVLAVQEPQTLGNWVVYRLWLPAPK